MKTTIYYVFALFGFIQTVNSQSNYKEIPLDSVGGVIIEKLIYYKQPLEIKKNIFIDDGFLPIWFDAYRITSDDGYYKNKPEEALKLYQKRNGMSIQRIIRSTSDTTIQNRKKRYFSKFPMNYIYGEIWFTFISTGEKIILTLNTIKEKEYAFPKFKDPSKFNDEMIDSLEIHNSPKMYIYEDGIYKVGDQVYLFEKLENGKTIDYTLKGFKGILYRTPSYIRSVKKDGKRIFETVQNTPSGPVVTNTNVTP